MWAEGEGLAPSCLPALGIQKNAQALQHMLKHPLLYASTRPKPGAPQKHYVPKEKRVNLHHTEHTTPPTGTEVAVTPGFPRAMLPQAPNYFPACGREAVRRGGQGSLSTGLGSHSPLSFCQTQRIPVPPPRKTRAQLLDDILIRMRDSQNVTEAPLGMTLAPSPRLLEPELKPFTLLLVPGKGLVSGRESP